MQMKLRVAVVGLGIGSQHIAAYRASPELFDVVAVCSLDDAGNKRVAAQFGVTSATTHYEELLDRRDIDVIDVCTPPLLHLPQARAALAAGKHVICEKPLASSLAGVDALIDAERASGRRLMPIFQYRFGAGLRRLKRLQALDLLGEPLAASVEVHWRRRADYYAVPWRGRFATELGGAVTTHAIHALDMLTHVFGSAQSVFARTATRVNPVEVEDTAAVVIEHVNGALSAVSITLGSAAESSRHRLVFARGVAESNTRAYSSSGDPWTFTPDTPELAPAFDEALAESVPVTDASGPAPGAAARPLKGYTPPAGYEAQFRLFHAALQTGEPFPVTLADARESIELLTAIYHSAEIGAAVTLPIAKDHLKYDGWK